MLSVLRLSDDVNERLCRCILTVSGEVKAWHTQQVKELRSCEGHFNWFLGQFGKGGYMLHLELILSHLNSRQAMEACSFICDDKACVVVDCSL